MGLAAGQARLLTITGRKSDCEFQSMRLSHQKIALARELADLSNEYQNSIQQTKLIYDFYGTGDTNTPLSYSTLMQPSILNDFMPTIVSDSRGRVTLNTKYAAAAEAAGIPKEGLGTLPSDALRNAFIEQLVDYEAITPDLGAIMITLPYNQQAGMGGGVMVAENTTEVTQKQLAEMLKNVYVNPLDPAVELGRGDGKHTVAMTLADHNNKQFAYSTADGHETAWQYEYYYDTFEKNTTLENGISLADILTGDYTLQAYQEGRNSWAQGNPGASIDAICSSDIWEQMLATMESVLDTGDVQSQQALAYAREKFEAKIDYQNLLDNYKSSADRGWGDPSYWVKPVGELLKDVTINNWEKSGAEWAGSASSKYAREGTGLSVLFNHDSGHDDHGWYQGVTSISLTNMLKTYLTDFYDAMNGVSKTNLDGQDKYVTTNLMSTSRLVGDTEKFTVKTGTSVSSDDMQLATFYDSLFNQICANGWTQNDKIENTEYLQEMLQSGILFISKVKEDGYYYQGNYSTDKYIKEISDDGFIAQAEAKYNTEKARLNAKEETLDLKMKNLDTEISSLTTEYDTVKNTISKQIEKTFTRYSA